MDQNLVPIVIVALTVILFSIVALVAITYRQKDIAAIALKILGQLSDQDNDNEDQDKEE